MTFPRWSAIKTPVHVPNRGLTCHLTELFTQPHLPSPIPDFHVLVYKVSYSQYRGFQTLVNLYLSDFSPRLPFTMADPVAEKSGFLKMYMSNHPDTLVAYAKWFGKVKEVITSAEMTAIDTKVRFATHNSLNDTHPAFHMKQSMTLTCTLKDSQKKVVVVAIEPPLSGYDDVKPRLLEMKALAQEGLGMVRIDRHWRLPAALILLFPPD